MFDILIIGGGSAGITAGIYAKRAGKNVAIIEKVAAGGQLNVIGKVENYTGFKSIDGPELGKVFFEHANAFEVPFIYDEVIEVDLEGEVKKIVCKNQVYEALAVIFALGCNCRELNIEGESELKGSGVSYCAVCDGRFFKGKNVAVVGSGDSAFSDALYLSSVCNKVYILTKPTLKMHNYTLEDLEEKKNIELLRGAISKKIEGKFNVESIIYEKDEKEQKLDVDGVFVAIGRKPETGFLKDKLNLSASGYIIVDDKMHTNIDGVYACGDIVEGNIKQISVAVGHGAIAGTEAGKYVTLMKVKKNG